jgi:hypothetical protein
MLSTALLSMLGACSTTTPVSRHFPEVPAEISKECGPLTIIGKPEVKLSELLTIVNSNYSKYHECSAKLDAWNEWYIEQKKAFDLVK